MNRYRIRVEVVRASGEQIYEVEARSKAHARQLYDRDEQGSCVEENLEAEVVGEITIEKIAPEEPS